MTEFEALAGETLARTLAARQENGGDKDIVLCKCQSHEAGQPESRIHPVVSEGLVWPK